MWTGFRLALGGAQERFGVTADLACFSKAVANGMPLSVLTGRADVMRLLEKDVFFFSTFGGEALSLAAAQATLRELRARKVPAYLDALGSRPSRRLQPPGRRARDPFTRCIGYGCRTLVTFTAQGPAKNLEPRFMKSFLQQELIRAGHSVGRVSQPVGGPHRRRCRRTCSGCTRRRWWRCAGGRTGDAGRGAAWTPVEPTFRQTTNFNLRPRPPTPQEPTGANL